MRFNEREKLKGKKPPTCVVRAAVNCSRQPIGRTLKSKMADFKHIFLTKFSYFYEDKIDKYAYNYDF